MAVKKASRTPVRSSAVSRRRAGNTGAPQTRDWQDKNGDGVEDRSGATSGPTSRPTARHNFTLPVVQGDRPNLDPRGGASMVSPGYVPGISKPELAQPNLGFNPSYQDQFRQLDQQGVEAQSAADLTLQRLMQNLQEQQRGLQSQEGDAQRLIRDRLASQGILRSGITQQESGNIGNRFLEQFQGLQQNNARQGDDVRRMLQERLSGIGNQRSQLQTEQARAEAEARQTTDIENARRQAAYEEAQRNQPQPTPTGQYQQPDSILAQKPGWGAGSGRPLMQQKQPNYAPKGSLAPGDSSYLWQNSRGVRRR